MADDYQDFGFGAGDDKVGKKSKRFKGKEGEKYRVSFAWLPRDDEDNLALDGPLRFTGCERHYVQGVGYFLHKGPEYAAIAGGPPKQSVATILVVWPTDRKGGLNMEAFKSGEGWDVMPWVFSAERYDQLKHRNNEFPLTEFDLSLHCTDTQYQKMDISLCRENLFRKLAESGKDKGTAIVDAIQQKVAEIEKTLRADMARDLSLDKIREKLGGSSSGPVSGGAAEDVDGLLEDILDDD